MRKYKVLQARIGLKGGALLMGLSLLPLILAAQGCALYKVQPPPFQPICLSLPSPGACSDFLIETIDHIDYQRPIGKVGDRFWGGQYQIKLSESLDDYLEAEAVGELLRQGKQCHRYPGPFDAGHMCFEGTSPLLLRLELQELTISRHPESRLFADRVIGVCKLRAMLLDPDMEVLYQRQFIDNIDTHRPTDALVFEGVGLISRAGISRMLSELLGRAVGQLKAEGIPQILDTQREYLESAMQSNAASEPDEDEPSEDTSAVGDGTSTTRRSNATSF